MFFDGDVVAGSFEVVDLVVGDLVEAMGVQVAGAETLADHGHQSARIATGFSHRIPPFQQPVAGDRLLRVLRAGNVVEQTQIGTVTDELGVDTVRGHGRFLVLEHSWDELLDDELFCTPQGAGSGRLEPAIVLREAAFRVARQPLLHQLRVGDQTGWSFQGFADTTAVHLRQRLRNRPDQHTDRTVTDDAPHGHIVEQRRFACTGRTVQDKELFFLRFEVLNDLVRGINLPR